MPTKEVTEVKPNPLNAMDFVVLAGSVASDARSLQLRVPGFSTPPSRPSSLRTIRRLQNGEAVVAVAIRGRTIDDVRTDLIDGVIATNRLPSDRAARVRAALLEAA